MKILVIGGTGHIGRFLVPGLRRQGREVTVITRGQTTAPEGEGWGEVNFVNATYRRKDEKWAAVVAEAGAEVVIDILGSDVPTTYQAGKGTCRHFIACGSIWMYGPVEVVPTPERTQGPCECEWYAMR